MIEWHPIETIPDNETVLLGWAGVPLIVRGFKTVYFKGGPGGDLPDEMLGILPSPTEFPNGNAINLAPNPPTHWAKLIYPTYPAAAA